MTTLSFQRVSNKHTQKDCTQHEKARSGHKKHIMGYAPHNVKEIQKNRSAKRYEIKIHSIDPVKMLMK